MNGENSPGVEVNVEPSPKRPAFLLQFARPIAPVNTIWRYDAERQLNVLPDGTPAVYAPGGAGLVKTVSAVGEDPMR